MPVEIAYTISGIRSDQPVLVHRNKAVRKFYVALTLIGFPLMLVLTPVGRKDILAVIWVIPMLWAMVISVSILIPGVSYLRLNRDGIEYRHFIVKRRFGWDNIEEISSIRLSRSDYHSLCIGIYLCGGITAFGDIPMNCVSLSTKVPDRGFSYQRFLKNTFGFNVVLLNFGDRRVGSKTERLTPDALKEIFKFYKHHNSKDSAS